MKSQRLAGIQMCIEIKGLSTHEYTVYAVCMCQWHVTLQGKCVFFFVFFWGGGAKIALLVWGWGGVMFTFAQSFSQ